GVGAVDDGFAVVGEEREFDGGGAGGDDDVFGFDRLFFAFGGNFDGGAVDEAAGAVEGFGAAFGDEGGDAADEGGDDLVFFLHQGGDVDFGGTDFDSVGGGLVGGGVE